MADVAPAAGRVPSAGELQPARQFPVLGLGIPPPRTIARSQCDLTSSRISSRLWHPKRVADHDLDAPLTGTTASAAVEAIGWRYLLGTLSVSIPVRSLAQ